MLTVNPSCLFPTCNATHAARSACGAQTPQSAYFIRFKLSLNTYMHFLAAKPMGLPGCSTSMLQKVAQGRAHATAATCRLSLQSSAHRRRLWRRLLLAAASTKHRVDSCTQPASWQQCWWPVWLRRPALALALTLLAGWACFTLHVASWLQFINPHILSSLAKASDSGASL